MVVPHAYETGINRQILIPSVSGEEVRVIQLDNFFLWDSHDQAVVTTDKTTKSQVLNNLKSNHLQFPINICFDISRETCQQKVPQRLVENSYYPQHMITSLHSRLITDIWKLAPYMLLKNWYFKCFGQEAEQRRSASLRELCVHGSSLILCPLAGIEGKEGKLEEWTDEHA